VLLNQKVSPSMLEKPRDRQKLLLLLRTFFNALKGFHVQYNVVSRETMLDAQVHPENHKDLIVRVAGIPRFSTCFQGKRRTTSSREPSRSCKQKARGFDRYRLENDSKTAIMI
jgi:formate C-acetyltransferase